MDLVSTFATSRHITALASIINHTSALPNPASRQALARSSHGSSTSFLAAALARQTSRMIVLILAHLDDADEALAELSAHSIDAQLFPALETLPGESAALSDLLAARLEVMMRLDASNSSQSNHDHSHRPQVLLCPIHALMQAVPPREHLPRLTRRITRGDRCTPTELLHWLTHAGYERVDAIDEPGQFSLRGDILDIFLAGAASQSVNSSAAVRVDFFSDSIDRLNEIDLETMASDRAIDSVNLLCATDVLSAIPNSTPATTSPARPSNSLLLCDYWSHLPSSRRPAILVHETFEVMEQARGYFERILDSAGKVVGPPETFRRLMESSACLVEVNQFSPGSVTDESKIVSLPISALPPLSESPADGINELRSTLQNNLADQIHIFAGNDGELSRLSELLTQHIPPDSPFKSRIHAHNRYLHRGFAWTSDNATAPILFVSYQELLHRFEARRSSVRASVNRLKASRAIDRFLDIAPGDYVVHTEYGIGIFRGLAVMKAREIKSALPLRLPGEQTKKRSSPKSSKNLSPDGTTLGEEEFLTIEFAAGAKLHVPCTKIDHIQKYVGGLAARASKSTRSQDSSRSSRATSRSGPVLSALGGNRWKKQKQDVAESVKNLAAELLRIRAAREHLPGTAFPQDTPWQKEFEAEFPFDETPDQLAAIAEIKRDMQSPQPMDRLVCGDVGFGKTELAIRAAFKACEAGKQVAVLVPTTVLAEQHERTFRSRFADYPFTVESISRFRTTQEINSILAGVRKGSIDVVIGTHRLLSKDVKFHDLGLVIIDEEQRFGVEHKERLLALRMTVDVLTLSATPIPRTLHMSMLGLRDISSLSTPPIDRRAVVTEVIPYNPRRIQQAIQRELARGGQCYYVHNRVHDILSIADNIRKLVPDAAIVVGHGQMPDDELENVMLRFMRTRTDSGKDSRADILVSTTIIESGIDNPAANTIFIDHADRFGLADLHQLRGRVGRSKHRAYCYLLLDPEKPIPEKSLKRLKAIEEYSMLGAGFKIAMRDLEIRGAGNILGPEQSGHIALVGYEMYCQLLENAVKELKNERTHTPSRTSIEIGLTGLIPKSYIPSDLRRMEAYRRLATAASLSDLSKVEEELRQAYGTHPASGGVDRLLELSRLRVLASRLNIRSITIREKDVLLRVSPDTAQHVASLLSSQATSAKPSPHSSDSHPHVTLLPPASTDADAGHLEIYFRPPSPAWLESSTLARVLIKRLHDSA